MCKWVVLPKQDMGNSTILVVLLTFCFYSVGLPSLYAFILVVMYLVVTFAVIWGNFSSTHLLQVVLISFLIGLSSVLLLKPAKKEVRNHAGLINSDNTSTEHGETHSNDIG